jgi:hypothetical protein
MPFQKPKRTFITFVPTRLFEGFHFLPTTKLFSPQMLFDLPTSHASPFYKTVGAHRLAHAKTHCSLPVWEGGGDFKFIK